MREVLNDNSNTLIQIRLVYVDYVITSIPMELDPYFLTKITEIKEYLE